MEKIRKVLITTIYSPNVVKIATYKLSPDVLIILDSRIKDDMKEYHAITAAIEEIKQAFKAMPVEIKTEKISDIYDVTKIAKKIIEIIDQEYKENTEIQIHTSGGRKTIGYGALFAAYTRKNKVKGVYYFIKETNKIIKLPLLELKLSDTKQKMLELINKGVTEIEKLEKELGITKALVYSHVKDLKHEGYIEDEEIKLTEIGQIAIM